MQLTRRLILLLFFISTAIPAQSQLPELINDAEFRPTAKAAIDSVYNFNFDGADQALTPWKQKYPNHPLWTLIEGMKFWWQVLSDLEDTSNDQQFYELMKKADYEAGKLLHRQSDHVDGLIIRAIANGYMARQHANRSEWITSMNYGRKAIQAYNYLMEIKPNLDDLKLAEGLKLYYLAYLPEEYPVVKTVSWALPDGNKSKGLSMLREAAKEAIFAKAEAKYFLGNINYNYESNYGLAVRYFEELQSSYPQNNYYTRVLVKSYYQQEKYSRALQFIDDAIDRWERQDLPHQKVLQEELLTWKGRILEEQGKQQAALSCYKNSFARSQELPNTSDRSFYVISGYLAGKILYDQKQFKQAKTYLSKVVDADAESGYRNLAQELLSKI